MVRFQTQGPGVALQIPNWDAEYKRQTPFKQAVGLYNMWQALSPDTRNWIAGLFQSDEEKPVDTERDSILDTYTDMDAGRLVRNDDGTFEQFGDLQYLTPEEEAAGEVERRKNLTPDELEVGTYDPYAEFWRL